MRKSLIIGAHAYNRKGNEYSGFLIKTIIRRIGVLTSLLANAVRAHFLGPSSHKNDFEEGTIINFDQKSPACFLIWAEELDDKSILDSLTGLSSSDVTVVVISPGGYLENIPRLSNKRLTWLAINPPAIEVMGSIMKVILDTISGPVFLIINHISMMPRLADQKLSDSEDEPFINTESLRNILETMLSLHQKAGAAFALIDNPKTLGQKNCALMKRLFQNSKT